MPYCATADTYIDDTCKDCMIVTESGHKPKCQMKYLGCHRVTIDTCATLGDFLQMGFPLNHFTHVLIDEAGRYTETEIIVAVVQVSKERGQKFKLKACTRKITCCSCQVYCLYKAPVVIIMILFCTLHCCA
ncbi:hypothetical protein GQX74_005849 [Glossina fuscipes]|nr:hypothetical protein GQX74_005849 [Glossina fuscipes]